MHRYPWKNIGTYELHDYREFIKQYLPHGSDGFVVEDVDAVIRVYSDSFGTDSTGMFMFLEFKEITPRVTYPSDIKLGTAQSITFKLIDRMLRTASDLPNTYDTGRYKGYFVVKYQDIDNYSLARFHITALSSGNTGHLNAPEFMDFLKMQWDKFNPPFRPINY